ncbi:MAG: right-handed parallel beta-helix repeat-containing protein, partial [Armatimonadota bacterium]|nr:right-handed parallel beta-helix repeat-containing protein [Armatimonadota bacterium]
RQGVGPSGWEGVKALALYLGKSRQLLVRFRGDLDPRTLPFTFAPRLPVVHISGAHRCVVRGLALRNAAYGVLIEDSLGSVVERCTIGPTDFGVWLGSGADRCTLRFNEIFMNPYAGADPSLPGAWDNWQAHKTGGFSDRYGIMIDRSLGGHHVHDNYVHDHWDGIQDVGDPGQNRGLRIHHNRVFNMSDDGLEPNGGEEDCHWYENLVERTLCGFRIKSPTAGPLYAYRNLFLGNKEDYRNFRQGEPHPAVVYVYHNTCTAGPAITSNKVSGIGTPNYHYYNNLFWCTRWWGNSGPSVEPNWKGDYNVYVRRGTDRRWETDRELAARLGLDRNSLWTEGDPGFRDVEKGDLSLTAQSPARGRGADLSKLLGKPLPGCEPGYFSGTAPDAGALPFGTPMPRLPRLPETVSAPPAGSWPGPEARPANLTAGPNLLPNGGFERGFDGWTSPDPVGFQIRRGDAPEGKCYLSIQGRPDLPSIKRVLSPLKPGEAYVLVYYSRRSTLSDMRVILRDPVSKAYIRNTGAFPQRTWRRASVRFVAPGPEVSLEVSPRSDGVCDLDGFALYRAR